MAGIPTPPSQRLLQRRSRIICSSPEKVSQVRVELKTAKGNALHITYYFLKNLGKFISILNAKVGRKWREKSQVHLASEFFISTLLKLYFASNVHKTHLSLHPFSSLLGVVRSSLEAPID